MENKPEQPTDNPTVADVEPPVATPEEGTPKKAARKRKKATAKRKRPKKADEPVAEPIELPLTMQEAKESLSKAKDEFVVAVAEPAMKALGRYSGMVRDALSGAVGGFLGNKKRED